MKILVLLSLLTGYAQQKDSVTAGAYVARFKASQYENIDSALYYIDEALALTDQGTLRSYHASLLLEKGKFLKNKGRFREAEHTLLAGVTAYSALRDSIGLAEVYNNLGIVYWRWLDNEQVMEYYMKSLAINKSQKNLPGQIKNYLAIGNYYASEVGRTNDSVQMNGNFQQAIDHYDRALALLKLSPNPRNLAITLQNKGNVYADTSFYKRDSSQALQNFRLSMTEFGKLGDSVNIAGLEISIGYVYEGYKDFAQAATHYQKALSLYRKLHQDAFTQEALRNLGNVYGAQRQYAKAIEYFNEGMQYAKVNNDMNSVCGFHQRLASMHASLGQHAAAYAHLDSATNKLHLLYEENTHRYKLESETKYETSRKESEIKLKTVQRDGVMIVLIVALSLSVIIVLLSRQRQKTVAQLREKEERLHLQQVDELLKKQEIKSLVSYLSGQEEERKRVAEDLHDRLGSTLSATKLYLNSTGEENSATYAKAKELLDKAVEEVREISHNLLSGTLSRFGLLQALEELRHTVSNTDQLRMEIFVHGVERLSTSMEITLYRAIQELVSNILKHANAKEITVQLNRHEKELVVTVEDDGAGFDSNKVSAKGGIGLMNVKSRIAALQGSVYVDSGKGHGTTVTINVPMEEA